MTSRYAEGFESSQPKRRLAATAGAITLSLLLAAPSSHAGGVQEIDAPVVGVVPLYETVEINQPQEVCREERVAYEMPRYHHRQRSSATGPLLGAVIGGAIGNAVGSGKRNKQVGVAVGALLGGSIGADIARQRREQAGYGYHREPVRYRTEQVCHWEDSYRTEQQLTGYRVSYRIGSETYETITDYRPGSTIPVRLAVTPLV